MDASLDDTSNTTKPATTDRADGDSTNVQLDIWEDVAEEIEDFIYLARLGCWEEALERYQAVLSPYQSQCFPVFVEYADVLLDLGAYDKLAKLCRRTLLRKAFRLQEQQALLQAMGRVASSYEERLPTFFVSDMDKLWGLSIFLSTIESLVVNVTREQFNPILFHIHELSLWSDLISMNGPWEKDDLPTFYDNCCKSLFSMERFWECTRLLKILLPRLNREMALMCFKAFFTNFKMGMIDPVTEQAMAIAYLTGRLEFLQYSRRKKLQQILDITVDTSSITKNPFDIKQCVRETHDILEHFFGSPLMEKGKGELFNQWLINGATFHETTSKDSSNEIAIDQDKPETPSNDYYYDDSSASSDRRDRGDTNTRTVSEKLFAKKLERQMAQMARWQVSDEEEIHDEARKHSDEARRHSDEARKRSEGMEENSKERTEIGKEYMQSQLRKRGWTEGEIGPMLEETSTWRSRKALYDKDEISPSVLFKLGYAFHEINDKVVLEELPSEQEFKMLKMATGVEQTRRNKEINRVMRERIGRNQTHPSEVKALPARGGRRDSIEGQISTFRQTIPPRVRRSPASFIIERKLAEPEEKDKNETKIGDYEESEDEDLGGWDTSNRYRVLNQRQRLYPEEFGPD